MLHFTSASNAIVNSRKAIEDCLENTLAGQDPLECRLLVLHSTIAHDFEEILNRARELCPNAAIAGCTCAGIIGNEVVFETMKSLGVMAVTSDVDNEVALAYVDEIRGENSYVAGVQMARQLHAINPSIKMMHILASGMDVAADKAIEGIESVFGADVVIFGGTSSDNMKAITSFQFFNTQVLERGAVLIGYADPTISIETGVHHGNVAFGVPFEVTRSENNRIIEIEGEPAWPYLMRMLGLPVDMLPGQTIPIAGIGEILQPEELQQAYDNKLILRAVVKVDEERKSCYIPVDCPVGTRFWLTKRDEQLIFSGLEAMIRRLIARIDNKKIIAVFHTDCGARGRTLFNKILKEEIIHHMQFPLMGAEKIPWLGMYGYGEFTPLGGKNSFHNYTTSIYAICRKQE